MTKLSKNLIFVFIVVLALLLGGLFARYYVSKKSTTQNVNSIDLSSSTDESEDFIQEVDETIPDPVE